MKSPKRPRAGKRPARGTISRSGAGRERQAKMTGKVLHFDAATHKVVDVLLPWYANGTLEGEERGS